MKVAVLNFSGNVGKTTVAAHLLKPRMAGAPIFSVESLNIDASTEGIDVEKMRGSKYKELTDQLMNLDSAIIDVGASNVEEFLKLMQRYSNSHEEFDYFIIPVVKDRKQQLDTVNTIRALSKLGIAKDKIRVVFNKVDTNDSVEEDFEILFGLALTENSFVIDPAASIHFNEVFDELRAIGISFSQVNADPVDYRAKLRTLTDQAEREHCVLMVGIKRLAVTANKNLDSVHSALFA